MYVYLDNNATTRPHPEVIDAMSKHFAESYANPGSRHAPGRHARQALEDARETIARVLDADPKEVILTSGGTESTNTALFGFADQEPGTILLTAGEHPATVETCRQLEPKGWTIQNLEVDSEGLLRPDQYDDIDWPSVRLASIILAHNETGVIQDIQPLASRCEQHSIPFHLDAVQAVGKIPISFRQSNVTSLALGAHKFHGPRGIGALILKEGTRLPPFQFGGHQESGLRPGTEAVALAVGMAKALEIFDRECAQRMEQTQTLRERLQSGLVERCSPTVVNGSQEHRLPNTLNIAFPGLHGEAMLVALDLEGVACSLGSTCASGSADPAPALVAMGCEEEVYSSSVRFSVSSENTVEEIDAAVEKISTVINRMRAT
ncbi:MAG: cysteine desulfurase family protein [Planctomycetaceae bacterium]